MKSNFKKGDKVEVKTLFKHYISKIVDIRKVGNIYIAELENGEIINILFLKKVE